MRGPRRRKLKTEVNIIYIIYVSSETGYINDTDSNQSKGGTRNLPDNLLS